MNNRLEIGYTHYENIEFSDPSTIELIDAARHAATHSYSPYSHFAVGAAARLRSGVIVTGTNQESEVFPAGICAERVAIAHAVAAHPNDPIEALAITSISTDNECYPCGLCRQTLLDLERRQESPIRVIMAGGNSATVVDTAQALLPFSFKL